MRSLLGLDPDGYAVAALHGVDRTFPETNCYADVWIELLHARGHVVEAAMAFTLAIDFEGDQWTFFKPPPDDLELLFGIDVHEMQLYRPMVDHLLEQLARGRTMIIEVDSHYLPDTAGTSYRATHVKSSIAIEAIDPLAERLVYFHGRGLHELTGDDYRGVFRLGRPFSSDVLPPYAEVVRFDAGPVLEGAALRAAARGLLARHLARRPLRNPWLTFGERLARDLPALLADDEEAYHAFAFATVRQSGAAFDTARSFVDWLLPEGPDGRAASEALGRQVAGSKSLLFKLARRRQFDPEPAIADLAGAWEATAVALARAAG
ncbi:MAG: DUF1839 family protein [Gaiellales bacterium]